MHIDQDLIDFVASMFIPYITSCYRIKGSGNTPWLLSFDKTKMEVGRDRLTCLKLNKMSKMLILIMEKSKVVYTILDNDFTAEIIVLLHINDIQLRSNRKLLLNTITPNNSKFSKSFVYMAIEYWNSLKEDLKRLRDVKMFTTRVKTELRLEKLNFPEWKYSRTSNVIVYYIGRTWLHATN